MITRNSNIFYLFCFLIFLSGCIEISNVSDKRKNVILFIGDGMGPTTVTAARIFDGQSRGNPGEENFLSFEKFPHVALVKTYNTNQQVADSAGTATAIHSGVKTNAGVIGVGPETTRGSCIDGKKFSVPTIAELSKQRDINIGLVTTARITHATPATLFAHSAERDWESDRSLSEKAKQEGCADIARQFMEFEADGGFEVVLGGGSREFLGSDFGGVRLDDSENLVNRWLSEDTEHRFVENSKQLSNIDPSKQILGLFSSSHMTYMAERELDHSEPTLTEMTLKALEILQKRNQSFYLLVEGGRIDHGHHEGKPGYALLETQEFSRAIKAALELVDLKDTLIMVTADHSHTMTFAGYPTRGNPILGYVVENDSNGVPKDEPVLDAFGNPYTTLAYINGPAAIKSNQDGIFSPGINEIYPSLVGLPSETHGGEDVALYGVGFKSELVSGVIDQNKIFDIIFSALFEE